MRVFDNRWVRVIALFLFCIVITVLITPGVLAYTYTIGQGDSIYIGDTADLSLVASWPDYQLAWCSNDEPGCWDPVRC